MSDIKSRLSVLVLLTELSIDDLNLKNNNYIYKKLVKVAPQNNIVSLLKKSATQSQIKPKAKQGILR